MNKYENQQKTEIITQYLLQAEEFLQNSNLICAYHRLRKTGQLIQKLTETEDTSKYFHQHIVLLNKLVHKILLTIEGETKTDIHTINQ